MMKTLVVGISGRSGSGKSTIVKEIISILPPNKVVLHSMDDYYLDRSDQIIDNKGYLNFDLPSSFDIASFQQNLIHLRTGQEVQIKEYVFNAETSTTLKVLKPAPIILVEGLFINHFSVVNELIDFKVFVVLDKTSAYDRRLIRDQNCRNYKEAEICHRFHQHAEPAYVQFIKPFENEADLIIDNKEPLKKNISFQNLVERLQNFGQKKGDL